MKRHKVNQINSMIKFCLEEDENLEDYDIQESNLEESINQFKRKKVAHSNSKW